MCTRRLSLSDLSTLPLRLQCDGTCHKEERNRRLAEALGIEACKKHLPDIPSQAPAYSDYVLEYGRKQKKFVEEVEQSLKNLVLAVQEVGGWWVGCCWWINGWLSLWVTLWVEKISMLVVWLSG